MENYGGGPGSSGGGGGGFPSRNRGFGANDPSANANSMMAMPPGGERIVQPLAHYANSNGILSRPGGGGGAPREDGGGGGRAQQPSHDVFMVREASRSGSIGADGRSPFATAGNRFQVESGESSGGGGGGEPRQQQQQQQHNLAGNSGSSSHSSSHHRERSERDRDKEKDHHHQQQQRQLPLPKMLKIAVVGESTSGKTAICNAFTSEGYNFSRNYHMTTGVSIYAKSIKVPNRRPGESSLTSGTAASASAEDPPAGTGAGNLLEPRINLVLVDSAGKPIYKDMLPQYWDRLDGVALVLDLTSSTALETALDWLNLAKGSMQKAKSGPSPSDGSGDQSGGAKQQQQSFLGVLIGSKTDLKDQRVISPKAAQDFASQHGLQYFECSAKENSGMEEPFYYLAHQWATTQQQQSSGGDKENFMDGGDLSGSSSSGGIFAMNRTSNGGNSSNVNSKRSAFGSRQQGSSSDAF